MPAHRARGLRAPLRKRRAAANPLSEGAFRHRVAWKLRSRPDDLGLTGKRVGLTVYCGESEPVPHIHALQKAKRPISGLMTGLPPRSVVMLIDTRKRRTSCVFQIAQFRGSELDPSFAAGAGKTRNSSEAPTRFAASTNSGSSESGLTTTSSVRTRLLMLDASKAASKLDLTTEGLSDATTHLAFSRFAAFSTSANVLTVSADWVLGTQNSS